MKQVLACLAVLLCAFSSSSRADDSAKPCELKAKAAVDAIGTPRYAEADTKLTECLADLASKKEKTEWAATRDAWAASLDKLPEGDWVYLMVSPDGTYATFGSHRHATREGNVVAIWIRIEFRELQSNPAGFRYKSEVSRDMYDCARMKSKSVANTYYPENNLGGLGPSYTNDETKVIWVPAIPGTVGDALLDWACKTVPPAQPSVKVQ